MNVQRIEDRAGVSIKVQDWQNRKTKKTEEFLREMRRVHDMTEKVQSHFDSRRSFISS